jgi:cyclophilin family peptidyl-prolyl cis-trans isomerase
MRQICLLITAAMMSLSGLCFAIIPEESKTMNAQEKHPVVLFKTTAGDIKVELDAEKAPNTVKNFLQYVNEGHFNETIFHRVIDGFMIQGGGFTKDMQQKPVHASIKIESDNGLKNKRGTIAMARTSDPNSATAQFFINVVDNSFLDFTSKSPSGYGYTVFGHVTEGMDTVDKIRKAKTGNKGAFSDVPVEAIVITEAKEIK